MSPRSGPRRPAKVNQGDGASRPAIIPVQRQTIASQALEALRAQILRGHFPDGEALRQDALARQLGVSRIPIREALRQLEAEGLVTFTPHCGAVVSRLSLEEIDEVFALRAERRPGSCGARSRGAPVRCCASTSCRRVSHW